MMLLRHTQSDTLFFRIFSFPFIQGDHNKVLSSPNSVVLTENTAKKYFGDLNAIGKILTIDNRREFVVTGIIENVPSNFDLQFDIVMPLSLIESTWKKFISGYPFEYHFLDDRFDALYKAEQRSGKIFGYFVILAIAFPAWVYSAWRPTPLNKERKR